MTSQGAFLIRILLGAAAVLVVPWSLPLLGPKPAGRFSRYATDLSGPGSYGFAAGMLIGSGPVALAIALPWTVAAIGQAFLHLGALRARRSLDRFAATLATFWLAAASVMACFALTGPGAPMTAEHLRWPTPAHFMYAGFALTTVVFTARRARSGLGTLLAMLGVFFGMPLLAIEIGFFESTQWTGALFIGSAALVLAVEQVIVASSTISRRAKTSLRASSAALAAAMVLAIGYGLSTHFGFGWLSLETMTVTHGVLNSLGFVLLAVMGWRLRAPNPGNHQSVDPS